MTRSAPRPIRLRPVPPRARAAWLLAILLLAGCAAEAPEPPPRPVLVARPDAAAGSSAPLAGEVRAREETVLAFRVGGQLVSRLVDVGDVVARGERLAELDPGDLRLQAGAASAELAAARAELARTTAERDRYASLARDQLVSRSALEAAQTAQAAAAGRVSALSAQLEVARNQAAYAQLRAPAAGAIAATHVEAGQVVAAGQPVFTLAVARERDVVIAVPEAWIDAVTVGLPVEVGLWREPGRRIRGTVREVSPVADPQTRTWEARVALRDADVGDVALGQTAEVFIARGPADEGLSIPLSALQRGPDGATVAWVVEPAGDGVGVARAVRVETGPFGSERVAVLDGLAPDALVVVAGGHLLREGQRVRPVDRDNRPVLR